MAKPDICERLDNPDQTFDAVDDAIREIKELREALEEAEHCADEMAGQLNALSDELSTAPDYPMTLDDFKHEIQELRDGAIGVYENEVISALEDHFDPQGEDAHVIHVALAEAARIVRGEPTEDGRTPEPCPQCKMTYGRHKMACTNAPDFPLRSIPVCGPKDTPA